MIPQIESKWNTLNAELLNQQANLKHTIRILEGHKNNLTLEVEKLDYKRSELERLILSYEENGEKVISNIKDLMSKFGYDSTNMRSKNRVHFIAGNKSQVDIETVDRFDFIEDLSDNLNISGVQDIYINDMARYLYAIFVSGMSPLLIGYNTRKIANAISNLFNGSNADIISLPPGFDDMNELNQVVNSSMSKVLLIENAVDNISDYIYLPLLKQNNDRFILFSMESSEHLNLISQSIFNYMVPIDVDSILQYVKNPGGLIKTNTDITVFNYTIDENLVKTNQRHLKKIAPIYSLPQSTKIRWAEVMAVIDSLDINKAFYCIIVFSLTMLCRQTKKIEELSKYIQQQDLEPEMFKFLNSFIVDSI